MMIEPSPASLPARPLRLSAPCVESRPESSRPSTREAVEFSRLQPSRIEPRVGSSLDSSRVSSRVGSDGIASASTRSSISSPNFPRWHPMSWDGGRSTSSGMPPQPSPSLCCRSSRFLPAKLRMGSRIFPGNFPEISRKFPGIPGNRFPGNFPENPRRFPGNSQIAGP